MLLFSTIHTGGTVIEKKREVRLSLDCGETFQVCTVFVQVREKGSLPVVVQWPFCTINIESVQEAYDRLRGPYLTLHPDIQAAVTELLLEFGATW